MGPEKSKGEMPEYKHCMSNICKDCLHPRYACDNHNRGTADTCSDFDRHPDSTPDLRRKSPPDRTDQSTQGPE